MIGFIDTISDKMTKHKSNAFCEGDLVFVKLKGFRHWPAKVNKIIKTNENNPHKLEVLFFGDNTIAQVKESSLLPYSENINKYGIAQVDNFKNKSFNKALEEAELAFKATDTTNYPSSQSKTLLKQVDHHSDSSQPSDRIANQQHNTTPCALNYDTLGDIETKIKNTPDADLETSLTLAAEIGNTLLAENTKLKEDLLALTLKNSQLAKHITETEFHETTHQSKINELENSLENLTQRNISLTEALDEAQLQLVKEKTLQKELEQIYEDQDKEREKIICNYEKEIKELRKIIKELTADKTEQNNITKVPIIQQRSETQDSVTQTSNNAPHTREYFSSLLLQMAQLKTRQDQVEHQLQSIQKHNHIQSNPVLIHHDIAPAVTYTPKKTRKENKTNYFSVSLQTKKYRTLCESNGFASKNRSSTSEVQHTHTKAANSSNIHREVKSKKNYNLKTVKDCEVSKQTQQTKEKVENKFKFKVTVGPPITAVILDPLDTFEAFYERNIDQILSRTSLTRDIDSPKEDQNSKNKTMENFLWPLPIKNVRLKA